MPPEKNDALRRYGLSRNASRHFAKLVEYESIVNVTFGVRASPATNEDWRKACDSDGVVSYYDYGVRLGGADSDAAVAASLEAKLKSFEATPEEERAATLGGMIPGSSGTDAFDISLYLAAIPLFGSLALFLFFPAIAPMLAGSEIPPPSA